MSTRDDTPANLIATARQLAIRKREQAMKSSPIIQIPRLMDEADLLDRIATCLEQYAWEVINQPQPPVSR